MSRYVISSKVIARELERNQDARDKRFYPGRVAALILVNLLLCILVIAIASGLGLV